MQVNMEIDRHGVALKSYFRRHLVPGRPQRHLSMRKGHDYVRKASCLLPTAALSNGPSSNILPMPQNGILPEQLHAASGSSGLVHQQGAVLREPSLVWQPDIVPATHMPHLEDANLVELAARGSAWEEGSLSEAVRELVEEEEMAAAAA